MKMKGKKLLWLLSVLVVPITYGGFAITGSLEPTGAPGSTMKTLNEIPPTWSQKLTTTRFELVLDGAGALDKETGLVWEREPDLTTRTWADAIIYAYQKEVGGRKGWRLPTVEELASLVDTTQSNPALPSDYPFFGVQSYYWSSTTTVSTSYAWFVDFYNGGVYTFFRDIINYVRAVRAGS